MQPQFSQRADVADSGSRTFLHAPSVGWQQGQASASDPATPGSREPCARPDREHPLGREPHTEAPPRRLTLNTLREADTPVLLSVVPRTHYRTLGTDLRSRSLYL